MLNSLLTAPMVFALSLKCGFMGMALKAARQQTKDAAEIGCVSCLLSEKGCLKGANCRLKVFHERERVIYEEIVAIRDRIARLKNG